ncbi:MAG: DUF2393 family protein [Campylobacterales bacterium]|nr:DUF2393 family protein [Campylobacterales bacterium]
MITLFNIWHYVAFSIGFIIFVAGVVASLKQKNKKLIAPMIFSVTLVTVVMGIFSIFVVDKYTKSVELYKLKNKRILSIEKIVYSGVVKNTGDYPIGEVTFKIKLVSRGDAGKNLEGGNFYSPSGFLDFFTFSKKENKKVGAIEKEFVVAKNLKPGQAKAFRVYFDYPPYFRNVSEYADVYGR